MEVSDVRRRLRGAIEAARQRSSERRSRVDEAARAWEEALPKAVVPAFQTMAQALTGEGHRFKVTTPGETARLSLERSAEAFIELALDTTGDTPAVVVRSTRGRGRRMASSERAAWDGMRIAELTEEDVTNVLLDELVPFIER